MNLSLAQYASFGRHLVTWSSGIVVGAVGAHVLQQNQADAITGAIGQIASGVASISGGVATLVAMATTAYGMWQASKTAQIVAVNAADNGVKVVPLSSPTPAVNEPVELHPVQP